MKKNLFLLVCMLFASNTFAQESTGPEVNSLTIYMEGNSGTLTSNGSMQTFNGNCLELGVLYNRSFVNVPWLKMMLKGGMVGVITFNTLNENQNLNNNNLDPTFKYNGVQGTSLDLARLEAGLIFADYFVLSVEHDFQINLLAQYKAMLPANQHIKVAAYAEIQPLYQGTYFNTAMVETPNGQDGAMYRCLSFAVEYGVQFGATSPWAFATEVDVRTSGESEEGGTNGYMWDFDSETAFKSNLLLRWNNTIRYNDGQGFSAWAQVRFVANNLMPNVEMGEYWNRSWGRTSYDVFLRFGLGYAFDLSK